jgi:hypothetical protein
MHVTTSQAAAAWGCSADAVRKLISAGLLPSVERRGVRTVIPLEVVQELAARHEAPLKDLMSSGLAGHREIAILRVGIAEEVDEPDRTSIGFSASKTATELREALRGWWRCDPDRVASSRIAPVTLGGFVVGILTGLDERTPESRRDNDGVIRHRFPARLAGYITDLAKPANAIARLRPTDGQIAGQLLGTRLHSESGGPFAYVEPA